MTPQKTILNWVKSFQQRTTQSQQEKTSFLNESDYWKTNRSEGNIISHLILRTSQKECKRLSAKLKITVYKIT